MMDKNRVVIAFMNLYPFLSAAPTPPMGWNSWDCFATTVTEEQTKAHADVMAEKLKPFGWKYVVVDIQWYEPKASSYEYRPNATLITDEYGRLLPAENRFPSASGGKGFSELADYVHKKGLLFGIHLMRGIPKQCVEDNTPVFGTTFRAADIVNRGSTCAWNPDMFGVDMSKPGAQEYYDSVFQLIASWGVDFVKVDDISRPYHANIAEIEAIRKAIDKTGRKMVLSLSPGETALEAADHVSKHANMWRISDDFWDDWQLLYDQFERCHRWSAVAESGHWPDADMLPIGKLRFGEPTRFTPDEQVTMMNLWSIARSPLMLGCDLTKLDDFTLSLITNKSLIKVNQAGYGPVQLFRNKDLVAWLSESEKDGERYLAVFNLQSLSRTIEVTLDQLGFHEPVTMVDLWTNESFTQSDPFRTELRPHASRIFSVRKARKRS